MIRVEGHKNLKRDEETGAIINTDSTEYNRYLNNKRNRKTQKNEIDEIKSDITEIKSILMQLLKEKNS
jgi:hypothetical protein|tara:strand:- start:2464 stop:2667 length:204 start_codon:yes stop_codon:yes gene_type:complete